VGMSCFVDIYASPYFKKGTREMNERIKELAEQAGIYNLELTDETEYWILEKFAELIVRECGNVAWKCGSKFINNEIKRHFGVKE
jgi:hypothetical protein